MLNEIEEYNQYTCQNVSENKRLNQRDLTKKSSLTGMSRAMITVASKFIFEEFKDYDTDKKIKYTKYILMIWMGSYSQKELENDEFSELVKRYGYLDKWMERYILSMELKEAEEKSTLNALKRKRDYTIYPLNSEFHSLNKFQISTKSKLRSPIKIFSYRSSPQRKKDLPTDFTRSRDLFLFLSYWIKRHVCQPAIFSS